MKIQPLSPHIGALVSEVTLSNIKKADFDLLYQAFLKYKVIFLRDQQLTPEEHLSFARQFGELAPIHPFFPNIKGAEEIVVIETAPGHPPGKSYWHTDLSWQETPSKCSILHAQHIPTKGGDTIWTSMAAVFQSLPKKEQNQLRELNGLHVLNAFAGSRYDKKDQDGNSYVEEKSKAYPPISHSLVKRHPETGEESLFINEQYTQKIIGLEASQSKAWLDKLFTLARQEQFQVRFQWEVNSVAIWDNRCTQHLAVTDYGDTPRKMHRATIRG